MTQGRDLLTPAADQSFLSTVFHVTHWKAGSQWVRGLLLAAAGDRLVPGKDSPTWFFNDPIRRGGIYTPVYATFAQFRQVLDAQPHPHNVFVVIRDPRDTAVSWYFSLLYSHPKEYDTVEQTRLELQKLDKTAGFELIFQNYLNHVVEIQRSWIEAGAKIFRYEDLLADQIGQTRQILNHCGIVLEDWQILRIVRRCSFRRRTWWRFGIENRRSHFRKGIAGDWKNHFSEPIKDRFKQMYGQWLINAGYERDMNW